MKLNTSLIATAPAPLAARERKGAFRATALALAASLALGAHLLAATIDLGAAGGYAALILPGGSGNDLTIKGGAAVNGDVGVSAGQHLDLGSGAKVGITQGTGDVVSGRIFLDPGATVKYDNQNQSRTVIQNMAPAVHDAIAFSQQAFTLAPTQTFNGLDISSGNFTITGNGGLNVITINGDIKLHGDGMLTLAGGPSDAFIFNISGTYNQSSKSTQALLGGISPYNIVWNFSQVGGGTVANIHAGQDYRAYGYFLAPNAVVSTDDTVTEGGLISQGHLGIGSKALVINNMTPIPEVSSFAPLLGVVGMAIGLRRSRQRATAA